MGRTNTRPSDRPDDVCHRPCPSWTRNPETEERLVHAGHSWWAPTRRPLDPDAVSHRRSMSSAVHVRNQKTRHRPRNLVCRNDAMMSASPETADRIRAEIMCS